jgi:hypothetical protein
MLFAEEIKRNKKAGTAKSVNTRHEVVNRIVGRKRENG